jgi:hypothetical protein
VNASSRSRRHRAPGSGRPGDLARRWLLSARSAIVLLLAAATVGVLSVNSCAPLLRAASRTPTASPTGGTAPYAFGTLLSTQEHATEESRAGVRVAMMELSWRDLEPQPGQLDESYVAYARSQLATFLAAGRRVTLGLGLSDPPPWAFEVPNSRLIDQHGRRSQQLNLIFNQVLRQRAVEYLTRVAAVLPPQSFWAVRIDSGSTAEMVYPGSGSYWAFDADAQNGADMPPSMARNPLPGWKPGTRFLGRQVVSTGQVRRWADWYVHALDDVAAWQMATLSQLGFRGWYQVLTPGSGVRPDAYGRAVAQYLPDGLTGVGAVWQEFYAALPRNGHVVAYVTSMADESGNDDLCQPGDTLVPLGDPLADSWSATRWISRIADEYRLPKNGENAGWNLPSSLNAHYRDTGASGMMEAAVHQMVACGFQGMYWAHDVQLWDGISSFQRYAALVQQAEGGAVGLPPMPG